MPGKTQKSSGKAASKPGEVVLLSGGNPQIPKGDGDAPVQAYIAAMPGWKHDVGRRLDAIIEREVPGVQKAVKWNTPFYGVENPFWFLSFHCMTKYIKITFFRGSSLDPAPPVKSKYEEVRYFHIFEDGQFDEAQFADWVRQASKLPGERMLTGNDMIADDQSVRVAPRAAMNANDIMKAKKTMAKMKSGAEQEEGDASASRLIDARIAELSDWRGETLARMRSLIKEADPDVVEEWKWAKPVWSHNGLICTGETYKAAVKTTFAKGAFLEDPSGLFNSSLEGNTRRAIDFRQGEKIDEAAFKALIRAAVALNTSGKKA